MEAHPIWLDSFEFARIRLADFVLVASCCLIQKHEPARSMAPNEADEQQRKFECASGLTSATFAGVVVVVVF